MVKFDILMWTPCDSRSDMDARALGHRVVATLLTRDPNTWGYFETLEGWHINIGYADIGLFPQAVRIDQRTIVGIDERLVGYDLPSGAAYFSYRMPLVFHEFIEIGDPLVIRDEMGFVGIASDGGELWRFCTEGIIGSYSITASNITGTTVDGLPFTFELPTAKH